MTMSALLSSGDACSVVADVDVEALVARRPRWWWNRLRRTFELEGGARDGFPRVVIVQSLEVVVVVIVW